MLNRDVDQGGPLFRLPYPLPFQVNDHHCLRAPLSICYISVSKIFRNYLTTAYSITSIVKKGQCTSTFFVERHCDGFTQFSFLVLHI